jgi:anti-sigma B factor antagonist
MQEGALMPDMDLGSAECGGYAVVALRGELDLIDAADVADALEAFAAREPRIIVDLAGLEFIDASGISALVRGRRHARDAGGDVLLAAPQRLVRQVLAIIREGDGFAVHASVAEAAASAGGSRQAVVPIRRQPGRMRDNASR